METETNARYSRPRLQLLLFAAVLIAQLGALGWMIADRVRLLQSDRTVILQSEPVDPRSLLSGDYVILNYTISRFDSEELRDLYRGEASAADEERETPETSPGTAAPLFEAGDPVYVQLAPGEPQPAWGGLWSEDQESDSPEVEGCCHQAVALAPRRELLPEDALVIRGTSLQDVEADSDWAELVVEYGIEQYFVPQNEGLRIEAEIAHVRAEIALGEDGQAALKRLFLHGKEVEFR